MFYTLFGNDASLVAKWNAHFQNRQSQPIKIRSGGVRPIIDFAHWSNHFRAALDRLITLRLVSDATVRSLAGTFIWERPVSYCVNCIYKFSCFKVLKHQIWYITCCHLRNTSSHSYGRFLLRLAQRRPAVAGPSVGRRSMWNHYYGVTTLMRSMLFLL